MNILWFTWKDLSHPLAGGAEVINEGLAKQLVADGHTVKLIVGGYPGCKSREVINGYEVIRLGNRFSVYWLAYRYYRKNLVGWADRVIEEINTIPFMTQWYVQEKKRILLIYQLCREIWFHQMMFPLNLVGYLLEPLYLFLLRNNTVLSESLSTKLDLLHYGFAERRIHIFPVFLEKKWWESVDSLKKSEHFTLLSFGSVRSMKQTHHQIDAFELAKKSIPSLRLVIAGSASGEYGKSVQERAVASTFSADISFLGTVSQAQKQALMLQANLILVSSVKEGWGMIVTEAGALGTPAVVYDVDGLRDSVVNDQTGKVVQPQPKAMSEAIVALYNNPELYASMRRNTIKHNQSFSLEKSYNEVTRILEL